MLKSATIKEFRQTAKGYNDIPDDVKILVETNGNSDAAFYISDWYLLKIYDESLTISSDVQQKYSTLIEKVKEHNLNYAAIHVCNTAMMEEVKRKNKGRTVIEVSSNTLLVLHRY
jgi:hypothetical protein